MLQHFKTTSLVGKEMKPNNLYKLFKGEQINYHYQKAELEIINYEFVKNTIIDLSKNKKFGRFVLLSKEKLCLKDLKTYFKNITFGNYNCTNTLTKTPDLKYEIIKSNETSLFCARVNWEILNEYINNRCYWFHWKKFDTETSDLNKYKIFAVYNKKTFKVRQCKMVKIRLTN